MTETLDLIDALQAEGRAVYVHCWAGIGRTGGRGRVPPDPPRHGEREALARIAKLREQIGLDASPEMPEQRALVERWR